VLELQLFHATSCSTGMTRILLGKHNFWQWEDEGSRDFVDQGWQGVQLPLGVPLLSVQQGGRSFFHSRSHSPAACSFVTSA